MTGAMPTAGFSQLSCRVVSVQKDTAKVRDQLNREIDVRRDVSRAKGALPEVGEQWIISRDLIGDWTFAAIIGLNTAVPPKPVYEVANAAERDAIDPSFLFVGLTVYRRDVGYHEAWDGTIWSATPRSGLIKRIDPATDLNFNGTTIDTQITFTRVAGREYRVSYATRFSQTNLNGTVAVVFRAVSGAGPILTTSSPFFSYTPAGNGANNAALSAQKYIPSTYSPGVYTIGVTLFSGSGGGASIAYGGLDGRSFVLEDMSISQQ